MPIDPDVAIRITAFDWVPDFAGGQARDLRVCWALEEAGQDYAVRYLSQGAQQPPPHRARQPFGQVPTYEHGDLGEARPAFRQALADHLAGFTGDPPEGFAEWEDKLKARYELQGELQ